MAFQTATESPSSLASPTTTTSTHHEASNGPIHENFSPTGSPPLIVAFLAVGLFSVAMVLVFGWQRLRLSMGWVPPEEMARRRREALKGARLGEKPQLWDLWIEHPRSTMSEDESGTSVVEKWQEDEDGPRREMNWNEYKPISATIFCDEQHQSSSTTMKGDSLITTRTRSGVDLGRMLSDFQDRLVGRSSGGARIGFDTHKEHDGKGRLDGRVSGVEGGKKQAQVAVIITMPSPYNGTNEAESGQGGVLKKDDTDCVIQQWPNIPLGLVIIEPLNDLCHRQTSECVCMK